MAFLFLRPRGLHLPTLASLLLRTGTPPSDGPLHVFFCIADHFEPRWLGAPPEREQDRVERWVREFPSFAAGLHDSIGRPPQHTFFFPLEEYEPHLVDRLAELCRRGFGDVEVHLHHDDDSSENLRETLESYKETLFHDHGLLARDGSGRITYGFIHGNWALDNSRPDGRWCGVDNEISVLRATGCYADFTMPSAPDPTQTRTVNSVYYALDDLARPKSHDRGTPARVGAKPPEEELLMVQGPLMLDWGSRKWGLLPRLENGDLHVRRPPTPSRLKCWLGAGVGVVGRPDWIFVKLHTHGAQEANAAMLLGEPMRRFHESLAQWSAGDSRIRYYYVTARELAELVHQAEAGATEPVLGAGASYSRSRGDRKV